MRQTIDKPKNRLKNDKARVIINEYSRLAGSLGASLLVSALFPF